MKTIFEYLLSKKNNKVGEYNVTYDDVIKILKENKVKVKSSKNLTQFGIGPKENEALTYSSANTLYIKFKLHDTNYDITFNNDDIIVSIFVDETKNGEHYMYTNIKHFGSADYMPLENIIDKMYEILTKAQ